MFRASRKFIGATPTIGSWDHAPRFAFGSGTRFGVGATVARTGSTVAPESPITAAQEKRLQHAPACTLLLVASGTILAHELYQFDAVTDALLYVERRDDRRLGNGTMAAARNCRCDGGMIAQTVYRATKVIAPYERNLIIIELSMFFSRRIRTRILEGTITLKPGMANQRLSVRSLHQRACPSRDAPRGARSCGRSPPGTRGERLSPRGRIAYALMSLEHDSSCIDSG